MAAYQRPSASRPVSTGMFSFVKNATADQAAALSAATASATRSVRNATLAAFGSPDDDVKPTGPRPDAMAALTPRGHKLFLVLFAALSLGVFAAGIFLPIVDPHILQTISILNPKTDPVTHVYIAPTLRILNEKVSTAAIAAAAAGADFVAFGLGALYPSYMSNEYGGPPVNILRWVHLASAGALLVFAGAVLSGIQEIFLLVTLMALWITRCESKAKDDVYYAQLVARKQGARSSSARPSIAAVLSAGEWFRHFWGFVPTATIVAVIASNFSFVLLVDPNVPLYVYFSVCMVLLYIVLSEVFYVLYLFGVGPWRTYVNSNFWNNVLHVIATTWVVVAFFVGGLGLPAATG